LADDHTFHAEIGGTTPGAGDGHYDQLAVTGSVTIGSGVSLGLAAWGGFAPSLGQRFTIVDNKGSEAVVGTFMGLDEGALIDEFLGVDWSARISYRGGDGNDVVLTVYPPAETRLALSDGILVITDIHGGDSQDQLTLSYAGGWYTLADNGGLTIDARAVGGGFAPSVTFSDNGIFGIEFRTLGGDDTVTVGSLPTLPGGFTICDGTGDDTANLNGTLDTGTGSIAVASDTVHVGGSGDLDAGGSGTITLTADGDIVLDSGAILRTDSGAVTVSAGGSILMADGAVIDGGSGSIAVTAGGTIALGSLQTTSDSATAVSIRTASGAVTDAGGTHVDIVAPNGTVVIAAATGIGSGNALETAIAKLAAENTVSGNVELSNTGPLTIATAGGIAGIRSPASVILSSSGVLTIGDGGEDDITAPVGTVDLTVAGVAEETGSIVAAADLRLRGTGTFALTQDTRVGTLAAAILGPLSYTDADDITVGSVSGTDGITTGNGSTEGGAVTITAPHGTIIVDRPINTQIGTGGGLVSRGQRDPEFHGVAERGRRDHLAGGQSDPDKSLGRWCDHFVGGRHADGASRSADPGSGPDHRRRRGHPLGGRQRI